MGIRDLFRKGPALTDRSKVDGIFFQDLQVCAQLVKHGIPLDKPAHSLFYLLWSGRRVADRCPDPQLPARHGGRVHGRGRPEWWRVRRLGGRAGRR